MDATGTLHVKQRRHTPEQVIRKLREADRMLGEGKSIAEVAKALEVSEPTYHRWRNQYGGMKADDAKRLLITHPGGGKTFGYRDYWDGHDLIYTGRRKIGDQQATAENLDVMEDRSGRSSFRGGRASTAAVSRPRPARGDTCESVLFQDHKSPANAAISRIEEPS
jgi:hypothetical protein